MSDPFQVGLSNFKRRLTQEEQLSFETTTLDGLKAALLQIKSHQSRRKSMMNLSRVKAFLEVFEQYSNVIEVFSNTSSILCYVWGPMKFCLQIASSWAESFDTLLDAYQQLAENIPLLEQYVHLFEGNTHIINVLALFYEDILEFHQAALRVFSRPTWKQIFRATWKDFNSKFQNIIERLGRHKALVESQATILQFDKQQNEHVKTEASFTAIQESILSIQKYQVDHLNNIKNLRPSNKKTTSVIDSSC
ncbi:hypothetical protein EAF04_002718 [Stromatinia cepivora]|nr:hypothetical protein EAF04_002718 [Stromatinia cepivora]